MSKLLVYLVLCVIVAIVHAEHTHFRKEHVNELNRDPSIPWKAENYEQFEGKSFEELSQLLGGSVLEEEVKNRKIERERLENLDNTKHLRGVSATVPTNFDVREKWPQCTPKVRNQGRCGSCWAFLTSGAFADRLCIATNGISKVVLSPEFMLENSNYGTCKGGSPYPTWVRFSTIGIPLESCIPYSVYSSLYANTTKTNPTTCVDGSPLKLFKTSSYFQLSTINSYQNEIMTNGPIGAIFQVYYDFYYYKSGVYQVTPGAKYVGLHGVKVVGWGIDNSTKVPYWLAENSWSSTWGIGGYFKMYRGNSTLNGNFETYGMQGGNPIIPSCYGISQSNSSVCNRHGSCIGPDLCNCTSGYGGAYCNQTACNYVLATNSSVCSGHGTCTSSDQCVCTTGYSGKYCQDTTCNGTSSTNSSVCSGRGTCNALNTCTCTTGYSGAICASYTCSGVSSTSSSVCSGRGTCTAYNICKCNTGYTGTKCETVAT